MFLQKKLIAAMMFLCSVIFIGIIPTTAAAVQTYDIEITISGLAGLDLAGFDLDVNYDDTLLTFDDYTLTEALGSFTGSDPSYPDAEDWSLGDDTPGTVNLSVVSYLMDFSDQLDAFVLATISFSGDASALTDISLSDILLSDPEGNAIAYRVDGTNISAVPVPGAIWLMGSALLGVAGLRRRAAK
jgi:hypothetical protein